MIHISWQRSINQESVGKCSWKLTCALAKYSAHHARVMEIDRKAFYITICHLPSASRTARASACKGDDARTSTRSRRRLFHSNLARFQRMNWEILAPISSRRLISSILSPAAATWWISFGFVGFVAPFFCHLLKFLAFASAMSGSVDLMACYCAGWVFASFEHLH